MEILHNTIGFAGSFLIIIAYLMLQTGRLSNMELRYSILNLVGAGCLIFSLCFEFNYSAFIVESFWVLISLIGIVRVLNKGSTRSVQNQQ